MTDRKITILAGWRRRRRHRTNEKMTNDSPAMLSMLDETSAALTASLVLYS
jgi:hypothetical protein